MRQERSDESKFSMIRMPLRPAAIASPVACLPRPKQETIPIPVMATRRGKSEE